MKNYKFNVLCFLNILFFISSLSYAQENNEILERKEVKIDFIKSYKDSFYSSENQVAKIFENENEAINYINFLIKKSKLFKKGKYNIYVLDENKNEWLFAVTPMKKRERIIIDTLDKTEGYYFCLEKKDGKISYFHYFE